VNLAGENRNTIDHFCHDVILKNNTSKIGGVAMAGGGGAHWDQPPPHGVGSAPRKAPARTLQTEGAVVE